MSQIRTFSTREENHGAPGICTNNHYSNVIKTVKMTSNSKQEQKDTGRQKTSFQKNRYKMQII